jgi:hypothetical protein
LLGWRVFARDRDGAGGCEAIDAKEERAVRECHLDCVANAVGEVLTPRMQPLVTWQNQTIVCV